MIEIRPAYAEDQDDLAAIYAATYRATFPEEPAAHSEPAAYRLAILGETQYLASRGGRSLGFASVFWPENFVHSLYIHPEAQGQGLGRALIAYLLALGCGPIELKTDAANNRALGFYRHIGFREIGAGKGEFGEWRRFRAYPSLE